MRPIFATLSCLTVLLVAALNAGRPVTASGSLLEAIRRNDSASVKALVEAGADVTIGDERPGGPSEAL